MHIRSDWFARLAAAGLLGTLASSPAGLSTARADVLSSLLPGDVPGYDMQDGVTVRSRLHPDQEPLGIRVGSFTLHPRLEEGFGYTSNALPGPYRRPSWEVVTAPTLVIGSDWSRDAFGAVLSLQDTRYLGLPAQDRTDGTVSAGGRIDVGGDQISISLAHVAQHEDRGQLDTLASDRPVAFTADNLSLSHVADFGRWQIVPALQATAWRYDDTTIAGVAASQAYRDRVTLQGDVTLRCAWADQRNVLLVLRETCQAYTAVSTGEPNPGSTATQVLFGLDYDSDAVWHWRLLVGGETRTFAAREYKRQANVIVDAGLAWRVTGLTSLAATMTRESGDAAQSGVSGLMLTTVRLSVDHEYLRNVLLHGSIGAQQAAYFQGGEQTGLVAELGATWVWSRSLRLSATYQQTDLHARANAALGVAGGYSRGVGLLTLRMDL